MKTELQAVHLRGLPLHQLMLLCRSHHTNYQQYGHWVLENVILDTHMEVTIDPIASTPLQCRIIILVQIKVIVVVVLVASCKHITFDF